MSKTIEGVPASFTREQYTSIFDAVGIDPNNTLRMTFDADGVRATVFELDAQGCRIPTGNGAAKHDIYIPVEPQPATTEQENDK